MALEVEDGDLEQAAQKLARAQDKLAEAIKNGATPEEIATAQAYEHSLQALGIELSPLTAKTLAVRAVPASLVLFFVEDQIRVSATHVPLFLGAYFLSGALSLPLWLMAIKRFDLPRAWLFGMVLSVRYPSREAFIIGLASEVRMKSKEVSKDMIAMFDGTVFHTVFSAQEFALPTD